ncbi:MAG TPA: PadR family transcriptional regulator [Candidatus Choladousia intestinigallinarum]|nr:PadR family transcriptional regulator [Candidatus Choladousia intestinigallinarum]
MDTQRKKGMLDVCVLAVLKEGPSYGYMIMKSIGNSIGISESTLYPILKRLEQNGSLKTYRQEYNGRMRKYYQLTPSGQKKIDDFLEEWEELRQMYEFVKRENEKQPWEPGQEDIQPQECGENTEKGESYL